MVRKVLLVCGILAALIYVGTDILAAMRWEGYSYTAQSVSELRAIEAPTRALLVPFLFVYSLLEIAFGLGVWEAAGHKRALRFTGILLIGLGVVDLSAYFFPLHLTEEVETLNNMMHIILSAVTVLLILLIIGCGATADGKWFRLYSYATILVLIVTGALAFLELPRIAANLPTPWLGVRERINIYGYMLWLLVLALVLWRAQATAPHDSLGGRPPTAHGSGQLAHG
jgi:hypothetical protein